jgi:uncharacterized protein YabN with tetrapyrrole methylase and pyrophosphatase domain
MHGQYSDSKPAAEVTNARAGSLTVVGTGIEIGTQTSAAAVDCIKHADAVYFVSADALTAIWLRKLNPNVHSLNGHYSDGKERAATYEETVTCVVEAVFSGLEVCFVTYGHPGVFAYPTHEAIRRVRAAGYRARMLPAISADACLFADLGIDPSSSGCQSFEATDFLLYRRRIDPHAALLLWQIGTIGIFRHFDRYDNWNPDGVRVLAQALQEHYPAQHMVTVYEAARYACHQPRIDRIELSALAQAAITPLSTLYVPPHGQAEVDLEMAQRLGVYTGLVVQ